MEHRRTILVRVSGRDQPGITAALLAILDANGVELYDVEQVTTRQRLTLDVLIGVPEVALPDAEGHSADTALKELLFLGWERGLQIDFEVLEPGPEAPRRPPPRHALTVMGNPLPPAALGAVATAIAGAGANIDRISRLSRYPVISYELVVSGGDAERMRADLVLASREHAIDVAVQREGLERRAKRLVVLDVDSTLIQDEVIELLADEAGVRAEVAAITERAMAGEFDFEAALRERVALLAGLPASALDTVRERVRLTPGARTFVRTLKRLGYELAIVSGGFTAITDPLRASLGIDHAVANELEIAGGRLTGGLVGPVVDRARKAQVLEEVAARAGIPLESTVAIGDGANDLDMLGRAGLGIAFNAKPVVRDAADTAVSVPYLDAVLFVLGIRRDEVEDADASAGVDGALEPVPGTPPV